MYRALVEVPGGATLLCGKAVRDRRAQQEDRERYRRRLTKIGANAKAIESQGSMACELRRTNDPFCRRRRRAEHRASSSRPPSPSPCAQPMCARTRERSELLRRGVHLASERSQPPHRARFREMVEANAACGVSCAHPLHLARVGTARGSTSRRILQTTIMTPFFSGTNPLDRPHIFAGFGANGSRGRRGCRRLDR